jgi:hypothetical protein
MHKPMRNFAFYRRRPVGTGTWSRDRRLCPLPAAAAERSLTYFDSIFSSGGQTFKYGASAKPLKTIGFPNAERVRGVVADRIVRITCDQTGLL